jgi:hypothetical protein
MFHLQLWIYLQDRGWFFNQCTPRIHAECDVVFQCFVRTAVVVQCLRNTWQTVQQPLVQFSWQGESLPLLPSTFSGLPWPHFAVWRHLTRGEKKTCVSHPYSLYVKGVKKKLKAMCVINNHADKTHGEVDSWCRHQMDVGDSFTCRMLHPCTQTLRWTLNGQLCGTGSGYVRFEVLSVVTMKETVFCGGMVDVCTRFTRLADYTASHPRGQLSSAWSCYRKESGFLSSLE